MTTPHPDRRSFPGLTVLRLALVWSLLMAVNVVLLVVFWRREQVANAVTAVRSSFQKDLVYRQWAAEQGGVYVPADRTAPNPYLDHLPGRDLEAGGRRLTLVNPAYMTRLVHELGRSAYGLRGHITSLRPLRPGNAPDPWEAAALARVEQGEPEVVGISDLDGKPHVRFLGAMLTQASCLKCHARQGYQVGDVRGGISVSVPLAPLWTFLARPFHLATLGGALVVWLVGLGALWWSARREALRDRQASLMMERLEEVQRLDSLGILAGGIAHDINNVLGAILGLSSAFETTHPPDTPLGRALATITQACMRGRTVVQGLLAFARKQTPEVRPLDLNALVREVKGLLERTTLSKVDLVLDLEPGELAVRGDAAALNHVLMNLCVNAVDAMPGGGTLTLRTRALPEGALLEVEDTGTGMSPEVLRRAREPFFTTKPQGRGTGLGLAIAFGTLKSHGGGLELFSEPGKGTTVALTFPPCEGPGPASAVQAGTRQDGRLLLLVDDDELVRASVPVLLQRLGHRVETAAGGEEALERLATGPLPDLVLLDMRMPGLDGPATLARIREAHPGLPVILTTGYADPGAQALAEGLIPTAFLKKPFSAAELREAIRLAMGKAGPGA
ncbi:MAG TPA: ATP-binding protein [Holophaga sp.]|nr:ATP-binding protein [Holophaga sp.]